MHAAAVVGDDLTGTMDTGHALAAAEHGTLVYALPDEWDAEADGGASVVGVNTGSRYDDPPDAAATVAEAVETFPARVLYKKIDSTLRGNLGAEVDAALAAAGSELAVVAPAFPDGGRTTESGVHYVEGTPVAETEYGADAAGAPSSTVADRFAAVDRPVSTVDRAVVEAGRDAVSAAFRRAVEAGSSDRAPVVVCDATTGDDLATIASVAAGFDALYVGSAGLAEYVTVPGGDGPPTPSVPDGPPLGVVGSVSSVTLRQLGHVPDEAVVELNPTAALTGEDVPPANAVERLRAGEPTVVTAATDRAAVERTEAVGARIDLSPSEIRDRVAAALGATAARLVAEVEPSGLFVTGGDAAGAVVRAFDATAVRLTGEAVDTGVPIGRFADGAAAGTLVVAKAGGFGTEGTIVNCLRALSSDHE